MALADPQSVTVSGSAKTLARVGMTLDKGSFQDATSEFLFSVEHSSTRRTRHSVVLQKKAIVTDPLVPSVNLPVSYSARITLDLPKNGVAVADVVALGNALVAWATSPNLTKVVGGES